MKSLRSSAIDDSFSNEMSGKSLDDDDLMAQLAEQTAFEFEDEQRLLAQDFQGNCIHRGEWGRTGY